MKRFFLLEESFFFMITMKLIHSLNIEEIEAALKDLGAPSFRAKQIWNWLYVNKVSNWDDMANLPLSCQAVKQSIDHH